VTTDTTTSLPPSTGPGSRRPDAGLRTSLRILGVGLALLGVGWGALSLASLLARATEHRSASYDGVRTIDLNLGFESVQIVGAADASAVSMTRSYTWSLGKPSISNSLNGGVLSIRSSCPFSGGLGCSGHVGLVVPKDLAVLVHTSNGSLTLHNLDGAVDVTTSNGSVTASNLSGRVTLRSSNGAVLATGLRSDGVDVATSNGEVRLSFQTAPSTVTARSSNGSIEVAVPSDGTSYHVTATTSNGNRDVSVPTDPSSTRRMQLSTSNGSIRVLNRR